MTASFDIEGLAPRLDRGESGAREEAIGFLVADPWVPRSGYAKERVARRLAAQPLTRPDQVALAGVCLRAVDAGDRWEFEAYCRLAAGLPASLLRDDLIEHVEHPDEGVSRRALWMLARLRRPRLAPAELTVAREGVVRFGQRPGSPIVSLRRLALRFWSLAWEEQLLRRSGTASTDGDGARRVLSALPRLHVADPAVVEVVVYALTRGTPPADVAAWFESARSLVEPGSLDAAVEPLLASEDPRVRARAERAVGLLG